MLDTTRREKITKGRRSSSSAPLHRVNSYRSGVDTFSFSSKTIGHDIAKDLHDHGVGASILPSSFRALVTRASSDVTMYQRSSTYIMSVKHGVTAIFGGSFQPFYELHVAIEVLRG